MTSHTNIKNGKAGSIFSSFVYYVLIKPLAFLNKYPVLLKTRSYHLVNFGTFATIGAVITTSIFFFYLHVRGYKIDLPGPLLAVIFMLGDIVGVKLLYIIAAVKKLSSKTLVSINETVMYNQGGLLGIVTAGAIVALLNDIPLFVMFDTLIISCTFSLFIGRIGCYNYGCCFGNPTHGVVNVVYHNDLSKVIRSNPELKDIPLIPTQLYSSYFDLFMFIIFVLSVRIYPTDGLMSIVFLFLFNGFRIFIQRYRFREKSDLIDFSSTAISYLVGSLALWLFLFGYNGWRFVHHTLMVPWTIKEWINFVYTTPDVLAAMAFVGVITFLFYGVHGRRLGTHMNVLKHYADQNKDK
jgi:prolipoprotein diacylglyceryltransferase